MKKLILLALALSVGTLSYAQGGKIIPPLIKSAAEKQLALKQAKRAYQAAARQYSRLTPPLVSSDYVLKMERNLNGKKVFSSNEWNNKMNRVLSTHIARLQAAKNKRDEALIQYGKALVEAGELSAVSDSEARRAVFVHQQPLLHNTKPFAPYVRLFEQALRPEILAKLPIKQQAMMKFLERELLARSEALNLTLRQPDFNWTKALKQSLTVARCCTQLLYLMQLQPGMFQEDLFRLYLLAAKQPKTPFSNYIKHSIRKMPFYDTFYEWLQAQENERGAFRFKK